MSMSHKRIPENYQLCPHCKKIYPFSQIDPNIGNEMDREQHISGICSDECWNRFLGINR